ncbi:competence protein ComG [Bacillus cereus]|uniref:Competence protein ComG n=1 Tax=Bacillus cereus TaxID=1396 RepID=A0A2C1EW30_BACCE|nr:MULTISPECIES: competence type IV pilus minor pilin ComGE [Bacillus cereus group]MDR4983107.1 competence type IV pilus minor pilin ComGE [Bacillus cereus]MEA1008527.1 competence type IV pilus minor pilin ComGE [Bacillus cereus]PES95834.1 competence protein ComG [Bacillus cereus]PFP81583.1 competence protein ComG [Bacillus cereus]PGT16812.1 competence protein ComG [Bacillus cereus]
MAEMLVALSLLMMAVSLLLPQTVLVMQERKNIQIRYKAFVLLKKEAALYMYENEEKRVKEKVVNGIIYYTYWGGNEVCAMWKDVKERAMEQCFYAGKKIN